MMWGATWVKLLVAAYDRAKECRIPGASGIAVTTPTCLIYLDSYCMCHGRIQSWAELLMRSWEEEKEVCLQKTNIIARSYVVCLLGCEPYSESSEDFLCNHVCWKANLHKKLRCSPSLMRPVDRL